MGSSRGGPTFPPSLIWPRLLSLLATCSRSPFQSEPFLRAIFFQHMTSNLTETDLADHATVYRSLWNRKGLNNWQSSVSPLAIAACLVDYLTASWKARPP